MRARSQRGLGSERDGCLASWQYAPTAGYAPAVIEGRGSPISALRQPADPGPMLRQTFCHNVNRALGRAKLFCNTIPPKANKEWRHVCFVPILLQKSLMASARSDSLVLRRFASEAGDDVAAQSRPRAAVLFILP